MGEHKLQSVLYGEHRLEGDLCIGERRQQDNLCMGDHKLQDYLYGEHRLQDGLCMGSTGAG